MTAPSEPTARTLRGVGYTCTAAALLSALLLIASVGGDFDQLVPFERIVAGSAPLAVAGMVADLVFYATFGAFAVLLGRHRPGFAAGAVLGGGYGLIGGGAAAALVVAWSQDLAGSADITRTVYVSVWNSLNAAILVAFMLQVVRDPRWSRSVRIGAGLAGAFAAVVAGFFLSGNPELGGHFVPLSIGSLSVWPTLAASDLKG